MTEKFYCLDCGMHQPPDRHGRCATCGSEAIAAARDRSFVRDEVQELERLFKGTA